MPEPLITKVQSLEQNLGDNKAANYGLDLLTRQLTKLSGICPDCAHLQSQANANLDAALTKPGFKARRKLRHTSIAIARHLREQHRLYPRGEVQNNWLGLSLALGTLYGIYFAGDIIPGFFLGLVVGVILGSVREKMLARKGRIY